MIIDATDEVTNPNGYAALERIIGVALHHTVTSISPNASEAEERQHIRAIDRYHVSQNWGGIGYHYLCFPSGRVYLCGRGSRAHVASRNHELVGIAWVADLSGRTPNIYEIAAAGIALRDAWQRIGSEVEVRGHRGWALPQYPTSCPGQGESVIGEVVRYARKKEDSVDIEKLRERVDALSVQVERLERLLCTNGGEMTVTADAVNAATLGNILNRAVRLGDKVTLKGDQIPVYLDRMGNNMWLGLAAAQTAANKALAATETLKEQCKPKAAGAAIEELRLLRYDDGSVRLIK